MWYLDGYKWRTWHGLTLKEPVITEECLNDLRLVCSKDVLKELELTLEEELERMRVTE